eukprot:gene2290-2463_t
MNKHGSFDDSEELSGLFYMKDEHNSKKTLFSIPCCCISSIISFGLYSLISCFIIIFFIFLSIILISTGILPWNSNYCVHTYSVTSSEIITKQYIFNRFHIGIQQSPFSLMSSNNFTFEINGTHTSNMWKFIDDIYIKITNDSNSIISQLKSKSRIGKMDFGQNWKNLNLLIDYTNINQLSGYQDTWLEGCY